MDISGLLGYLREHALASVVNLAYVSLMLWYGERQFKRGREIGEQLAHLDHTIREQQRRETGKRAAEAVVARHAQKKAGKQ